jgi:hypothetical protein
MFPLSSHPKKSMKIKCFVEHYSNYYLSNPNKNNNNIIKWSKNSKNWYEGIMWVYKLAIKILNNFNKTLHVHKYHISHIVSNM